MTEKTPEELFKEMNLSKVLIAIMETVKEVSVPLLTFLDSAKKAIFLYLISFVSRKWFFLHLRNVFGRKEHHFLIKHSYKNYVSFILLIKKCFIEWSVLHACTHWPLQYRAGRA